MVRGKALFDQGLLGLGQLRIIEFNRTADKKLALLNSEAGQFFKNLGETHTTA